MCELELRGVIPCVPIKHGSVDGPSKILAAVRRAFSRLGDDVFVFLRKRCPKAEQPQFSSTGVTEPQPEAV